MITLQKFQEELTQAISGPKPKYALVKANLEEISGVPTKFIHPKLVSAHNQVSPRASESLSLRNKYQADQWVFVGIVTAEGAERDSIIKSLKEEVKLFANVAIILANPPNWSTEAILCVEDSEQVARRMTSFFNFSESNIEKFEASPIISSSGKTSSTDVSSIPSEDLFLSEEDLNLLITLLKDRKAIILQGAPGVGKSFIANKIAYLVAQKPENIKSIQFHPSYGYEDFVQGWRPNKMGGFTVTDGLFVRFCNLAIKNPQEKFIFIIEEINRGNLPKILGELMTLVEVDKRYKEYSLQLTYHQDGADDFYVPENVLILGTMNTADRSLALLDYALRRRFAFQTIEPAFGSDLFEEYLLNRGVEPLIIDLINEKMINLNLIIADDKRNLGPGFEIGHSFFCPLNMGKYSKEWYEIIIKTEIAPLIKAYWFDNEDFAQEKIADLLS